MFKIYYKAPFCYLSLHSDGQKLVKVDFEDEALSEKSCEILEHASYELDLYFAKKLKKFSVELDINSTIFENSVYKALLNIPYGTVKSYKQIAQDIGRDKAYRAVGNANAKNKLPVFIPCHRVVASNSLGGYSGGLHIKRFLLDLEGVNLASLRA
ncbi:MAG TPA: methylated-DNA--[protein]-cysteine S-methyltransferase [Campylobacter avium]|uniref:methylated-DNA--[protein]-cysteine S-methyltransferase n=1 Tax=Campylobacter avium TaxID=522485 RepID=UPI001E1490A6|nr:methylated-DNA--[protein]-cysteine S-methyltransferase [Campylobacter avium]HJE66073.1 methylated-DNA--[protein]-cysteine S-methyltransferase [Campylobacter avium]